MQQSVNPVLASDLHTLGDLHTLRHWSDLCFLLSTQRVYLRCAQLHSNSQAVVGATTREDIYPSVNMPQTVAWEVCAMTDAGASGACGAQGNIFMRPSPARLHPTQTPDPGADSQTGYSSAVVAHDRGAAITQAFQ